MSLYPKQFRTNVRTLKEVRVALQQIDRLLRNEDLDGDQVIIDFTPANYTPDTSPAEVTSTKHLSAHLAGISNELGGPPNPHAATHERAGTDEIDGDHLDIDFTPDHYSPDTVPAEAANVDDLAAHLSGIDNNINTTVQEIQAAETVTIPVRRQMVVHDELKLDGVLLVQGDLFLAD